MQDKSKEAAILRSWHKNVEPWTRAVRESEIRSRVAVSDAAIVNAIIAQSPKHVLDLGCGEGWLVRALADLGVTAEGVDAVAGLIDRAQQRGGTFSVMSYEEFAAGAWQQAVDCVACNFSLLGHQLVEDVLAAIAKLINEKGRCVIQTLHPAYSGEPYCDGWREGSWQGFSEDFSDPAPWYFRTLATWLAMFKSCGLQLEELIEPLNAASGSPASIIFVLRGSSRK